MTGLSQKCLGCGLAYHGPEGLKRCLVCRKAKVSTQRKKVLTLEERQKKHREYLMKLVGVNSKSRDDDNRNVIPRGKKK